MDCEQADRNRCHARDLFWISRSGNRGCLAVGRCVNGELEEVVVTATRKDESLSKFLESIVALGKAEMDAQGVRDISDIARLAPGINLLPLGGQATYASESVWSYEVGSKNSSFDGRLQVDASVFTINWNKIQRQTQLSSCGSALISNLLNARSTGFDIAIGALASDRLTIGASGSHADARLTQDVVGPAPGSGGAAPVFGYSGDKIGGAPWSATATADYLVPLSNDRKGCGHIDFQHISGGASIDFRVFGTGPEVGPSDAYNNVAARLGVRFSGVDPPIFANNLLNEAPILTCRRDNITALTDQLLFETRFDLATSASPLPIVIEV